jgi:hypothetical protein
MKMAAEIKRNLISRIKDSEDLNFLEALQNIFDSSDQTLFQLSSAQQAAIDAGRNEIINEQCFKNEAVIAELEQWLKSR